MGEATGRQAQGRSWFRALASQDGQSAEISIYDEIGAWGINAREFQEELKALGPVSEIGLRINSPGGDVFDGLAIYNMLRRHKARVSVTVDGIAASMASVIAMAGDEVAMPENAMMMIHDPAGIVIGTSKEMRELADTLDKVKQGIVSAYAAKSGAERDEIGRLMADETWLTAAEALDLGLADSIEEPVRMAAHFDLSHFRHPPTGFTARSNREEKCKMGIRNQAEPKPGEHTPGLGDGQGQDQGQEPRQQPGQDQEPDQGQGQGQEPPQGQQPTGSLSATEREQIIAAERKRAADIHGACALAARADLAPGFIAEGKSLSDVVAALQQQQARPTGQSSGQEISTHNTGGPGQQAAPLRVDVVADMRRRAGVKEG